MHLCTRKPLFFILGCGLSVSFTVFADIPENSGSLETMLVQGEQIKLGLETEQALTPGGVTLLDGAELYQRNVTNLADMLRYVPGMWVASGSTGDSTFFSSRGSNLDATNYDGNGIKLLQDGLPVTAADGNNHNRALDPLGARYAIVARGANALTYGASTLGGAIDFVTPTARDTEQEIFLNGGSHGQLQGRITTGAVAGNVDGLITLEARRWDGFRDHHQQEREGLYANTGWQVSDALQSRFYFTYVKNNQELPGALSREEFDQDPYQAQASAVSGHFQFNVETWRVANKTQWDINDNSSLSIGIAYEEQALYHPIVDKVMVDFDGPGPMPPTEVFSLLINTDQNNVGTTLRYNLRLGNHDLLAGINYGETTVKGGSYRNDSGRRNGLTTRVDNNADSMELFLADRWQLTPQWKLIYGVQAVVADREVRNTTVANGELYNPRGDYDSINPRVGVIYQLAQSSELFANVSRLYEAPTNYELEDDACKCDAALDAMHGSVFEMGTRGSGALGAGHQWQWELALYYAQLQDEILSIEDPDAPGTSLSSNVDDTIHAGLEALIGASFLLDAGGTHRIEPLVNLTINEFSFDNDPVYGNNQLPVAPGYAIKGEILYRHANGFFAGPTFDVIDERYADFRNTYTIDAYALLGLRAGFQGKSWEIFGEARNLTDEKYVSVFSVKEITSPEAAILQAGEPRSVYVGIKWQL
ncbi:TonB-dependent receptor family protein [Cellvibrio sp. ARAG 10.3]|uniref:TonB-dependent receptor family protein n=1 Tax=Cellvibrio sp. ARAG 10.3 TaxID=3451358 RepID=UPI003F448ABF